MEYLWSKKIAARILHYLVSNWHEIKDHIGVRLLSADNVELGTACGKLHRVSALAITDAGEAHPGQLSYVTIHFSHLVS